MKIGSKLFLSVLLLMSGVYSYAQEGGTTTETQQAVNNTNATTTAVTSTTVWYTNPIVWVVGGVVLVLILVLALSNRNKSASSGITRSTTTRSEVTVD